MIIIASIICGGLICWLILAVWKSCNRDYEQEGEAARNVYYDKILKN